jgi:hypothetical protein
MKGFKIVENLAKSKGKTDVFGVTYFSRSLENCPIRLNIPYGSLLI